MDGPILDIVLDFHQEDIDLFLRPSQYARKQRQREALNAIGQIPPLPKTQRLLLVVLWPAVGWPF